MFYAIECYENAQGVETESAYTFTAKRLRNIWVNASDHRVTASARHPLVRKADYLHDGDSEGWAVLAIERVDASKALRSYRYELVEYEWGDRDHSKWVATAAEHELIGWAKDVQHNS